MDFRRFETGQESAGFERAPGCKNKSNIYTDVGQHKRSPLPLQLTHLTLGYAKTELGFILSYVSLDVKPVIKQLVIKPDDKGLDSANKPHYTSFPAIPL